MDHWFPGFTGRCLERPVYIAVKWARLVEYLIALRVLREFSRIGVLRRLEVDFDRVDHEQELNPPSIHESLQQFIPFLGTNSFATSSWESGALAHSA